MPVPIEVEDLYCVEPSALFLTNMIQDKDLVVVRVLEGVPSGPSSGNVGLLDRVKTNLVTLCSTPTPHIERPLPRRLVPAPSERSSRQRVRSQRRQVGG